MWNKNLKSDIIILEFEILNWRIMEQKLQKFFLECVNELNKIGIDILNEKQYGKQKYQFQNEIIKDMDVVSKKHQTRIIE